MSGKVKGVSLGVSCGCGCGWGWEGAWEGAGGWVGRDVFLTAVTNIRGDLLFSEGIIPTSDKVLLLDSRNLPRKAIAIVKGVWFPVVGYQRSTIVM